MIVELKKNLKTFKEKVLNLDIENIKKYSNKDEIIKIYKTNKRVRIGIYSFCSVIVLMILLILIPQVIKLFIPLDEKDKVKIANLDKKYDNLSKKYIEKTIMLETLIDENRSDKLKLQKMRMRLLQGEINIYRLKYDKVPNKKQVRKILSKKIPEPFSSSRKIHFENNEKGGWFYSLSDGTILPNID